MKNIEAALLREVEAGVELYKMHKAMKEIGVKDDPFWNGFVSVADGIYQLIGEKTETFEESITCLALTSPILTNSRRTGILMSVYRKNFVTKCGAPNDNS